MLFRSIRRFKETHGFPVVTHPTRAARAPQVIPISVQTRYTCALQLDGEEENVSLWDGLIALLTQHGCDPSCVITVTDPLSQTLFRKRLAHAQQEEQQQRDALMTLARMTLVSDAA